jgi:hypothetical protein
LGVCAIGGGATAHPEIAIAAAIAPTRSPMARLRFIPGAVRFFISIANNISEPHFNLWCDASPYPPASHLQTQRMGGGFNEDASY